MSEGRRLAGQHARSQAKGWAARMLVVCAVALLALAISWLGLGLRGLPLVAVEAVVIGLIVLADRWVESSFRRWDQGAMGEEEVGKLLEGLASEGWHVTHDISLGGANVDHVLVGPGGIFAIETKSQHGRIGIDSVGEPMLRQAYAEMKLVERITGMRAQALLVFSHAYLVGRVPARRRGVTVLPARMLEGYLRRQPTAMSVERALELHERFEVAVGQGVTEPVLS